MTELERKELKSTADDLDYIGRYMMDEGPARDRVLANASRIVRVLSHDALRSKYS